MVEDEPFEAVWPLVARICKSGQQLTRRWFPTAILLCFSLGIIPLIQPLRHDLSNLRCLSNYARIRAMMFSWLDSETVFPDQLDTR